MIADALERFARERVVLAGDQQLRRFANLRAIAFGRDALGARVLPQRTSERLRGALAQARIVSGPPHRVAQRADLGVPRRRARGTRQVHAYRTVVLAREGVALRRDVDV